MKEYIIVGDTVDEKANVYKDCLISACCCYNYNFAQKCLEQAKIDPYNSKYTNIHISSIDCDDAWWANARRF